MECRLCLCAAPVESSVSIHDYPHPLVRRILTCCQLQVDIDDSLPDTICLLCRNNLRLLSSFKNICIQSEKTQKLRLAESSYLKKEEIILDDLIWEDDIDSNSTSNVCQPTVEDEINKLESRNSDTVFFEADHSRQNATSIENENILEGKSTQENPYTCETCSKSFKYRSYYARHVKTHVKDSHKCDQVKSLKCEICSKMFMYKSNLEAHMNSHKGIKPFQCDVCFVSFTQKSSLKIHAQTHIGQRLFKCDICPKSFTLRGTLMNHVKCHTGVKPHKCEMCSRSFTLKYSLVFHMKSHTGTNSHICEICSKSFADKSSFVEHINSHSGIKPHQCKVCLISFTHRSSFRRHVKTHTGEKLLK
ncbi:uncharacterized protein LOC143909639 [Arctopsyche grandis]|uniref:uncharacterized protein LOC143909639 n=1 Tax=Arctopsyche grandis TaxID=121162 RepID=UPI00406D859C